MPRAPSVTCPSPAITTSFAKPSSFANFVFILKLHDTIPPKALIGSQARADL